MGWCQKNQLFLSLCFFLTEMFRFLIQFLKSAFSDEFFIVTALMVRDTGSICLFLKEFPAQTECRAVLEISCPNRTRKIYLSAVTVQFFLWSQQLILSLVLYLSILGWTTEAWGSACVHQQRVHDWSFLRRGKKYNQQNKNEVSVTQPTIQNGLIDDICDQINGKCGFVRVTHF